MLDSALRPILLVVDDKSENLDVLSGILSDRYQVETALSGQSAFEIIASGRLPDLILLDVMMPVMDGFEVCGRLKSMDATAEIPVIFLTASEDSADEMRGFELGAVDYIAKPIRAPIVRARVATHIELVEQRKRLREQNDRLYAENLFLEKDLQAARLSFLKNLGQAAEHRDDETGMHIQRMSRFTQVISLAYGQSFQYSSDLLRAAPLHDVGKIGIPDRILLKAGSLDAAEWEVMRRHPQIGGEILEGCRGGAGVLAMAYDVALRHHEKWNGTGYPDGLSGEEIPLSARIVAVADVFDALTSERPYKKSWSLEDAIALIRDQSGQHFQPEIVRAFNEALPEIFNIREELRLLEQIKNGP